MKYVGIVDGYSSGNLLAPEFKARGYECIHIQSTPKIWDIFLPSYRPEDYVKHFAFDENLEFLVDKLRELSPVALVAGTETGVELCDELTTALKLPGNGTALSAARRNKYLMVEAVRAAGLNAALQLKSASALEIATWFEKNQLAKIVIKPINSAWTDGMSVCTSKAEIENAVAKIIGKVNLLGLTNSEVLAQEYLAGTEYFVNSVSCKGKHHITEIWQYQKRSLHGQQHVYDCNELRPYDGEIETPLHDYVLKVLDALGIKYGPAHTEVMVTEKGLYLVELGARLDGLSVPSVNQACVGYGPLDLTADAFVDEQAFLMKTANPYVLEKKALTVYLTSYQEGTIRAIPGEESIRGLDSFFQIRLKWKPGSKAHKTVDFITAPGFLTLVHPEATTLQADYENIRSLERTNLLECE